MSKLIHNGEFVWGRNEARRHWECVSASNRKTMKKHVLGEDQLTGFYDLLIKDKLKVVKAMGWPSASVFRYNQTGEADPLISEYEQISGSESEDDAFAMLPLSLGRRIGAQHVEGLAEAVGRFSIVEYVFI